MFSDFIFSVSSTLPILLVMIVGYILKRKHIIDDNFIDKANVIVFNIALPVKLFNDVYKTDLQEYFDLKFIVFIVSGTILSALLSWLIGIFILQDKFKVGAFAQGAFRGNFLYIGLSLMENITGSIGLKAPLAIAFIIPLYNILTVIILSCTNIHRREKIKIKNIVKNIVKNPLIIAVLVGVLVSQVGISLPTVATRTFSYFEAVATPLALITIGGSFCLEKSTSNLKTSLLASTLKLLVFPMLIVLVGFAIGLNNEDIVLAYILFGVPTATVSYVMSASMGGDKDLSSNIIMVTTLLSNFTMTLFVFIFKTLGIV